MSKEVVHSSGMEKLVFLSTIDESRNKSKISKIWDITVSGGPLYKKSTNRGLEHYEEKGLIQKNGNTFSAKLDSEAFKQELTEVLEDSSDLNDYFKDDLEGFISFLKNDKVVNTLLTPQTIRKCIGDDKESRLENIRSEPLGKYFEIILNVSIKLWMDNQSEEFFDEITGNEAGINSKMMHGMVKGMFSTVFDEMTKDSPYDVNKMYQEINNLYKSNPESTEYLIESYNDIVKKRVESSLSGIM